MPIITGTVPERISATQAKRIRKLVAEALEAEGVNPNEITVEFTPCVFPERLVIYYFSRSPHLDKDDQRNKEAKIIGKIFMTVFDLDVECLVTSLEKSQTGIFVS